MGMFDYIRCEMPLPEAAADQSSVVFQTKDTPAQDLDSYVITADGLLMHEGYKIEDRSDPDAKPGSLESFYGCATKVHDDTLNTTLDDFHGDIWFGGYVAKFTDGQCVNISIL